MAAPPPMVDKLSGATVTIGHEENNIHQGEFFTAHFESSAPLPTNVGDETAISFRTPAEAVSGKRIHLVFDISANDESIFEFREAPTIVLNNESTLPILNRLRSSPNTSVLIDRGGPPTVGQLSSHNVAEANLANLGGGTILFTETLAIGGAAPFGGTSNGQSREEREWILNFDTEYVFILTNNTVNNTLHHMMLEWYEHADSNYGH